ncbi:hypothetical protein BGZ49_003144 [Haplosporangium sp. Z 27]|nr:hypothetical protein BGZ49_003144 [Haplosporangium sp. Z 27]
MSLPPTPTKTSVSSFLLPPKLSVPPPLSLSLSVPPSAVPSLSSASSSCSSTISSSLSSSPPTSRFVFPATAAADRKDWWQGLSLAETPEEESDGQSSVGGSSEPSPCTAVAPVLPQPTFYRNPHKDNSLEGGGFGCGGEQDHFGGLDMPFLLQPEFYHVTPPPTTSSTVGGVNHLQQNRVHVVRTPSPQPIQTGFCSISNKPVNQDGESSLQDFLGEADLPFPLPSTLQERQARQRKRAEQLRRLQAREEREARQSRRRGSSFCAGMPHPTLSLESLASLSLSPPSTTVSTPPITVPTTTATIKAPTPTRPGLVSRSNSILLASLPSQAKYSTPLTKCEETKSSDKKLERHVGFDLTRTSVFEYEVGKECFGSRSPSPESSATTASTSNTVKPKGYSSFRLSAGRTAYGVPLSPP